MANPRFKPHPNPEQYFVLLINAYREEPNNHARAAKLAGVTWTTARNAWERGHRKAKLGPIKDLIHAEQQRARALLEADRKAKIAAAELEKQQAREQATLARKQEGQMTTLVRASSLQALTVVGGLAQESRKLYELIQQRVQIEKQKISAWSQYENDLINSVPNPQKPAYDAPPMSLEKMINILNRAADYSGKIIRCAEAAMEMERLHLGEPIATIAIIDHKREVTTEELDVRTENALKAINRARIAGGLRVIEGGKREPTVGQRVILR